MADLSKQHLPNQELSKQDITKQGLSKNEVERFSRQLLLPEIGTCGQLRLKHSKVLVVGAGGLGSPAALYLAAAGVGELTVLDYDVVEASNLQRQIIHSVKNVGKDKATSAKETLDGLANSEESTFCKVKALSVVLDSTNALEILKGMDVVLDCSDNVATRYLLSDACVLLKTVVLVSGSALRLDGQLTVYNYNSGPCYRCIFPTPPPPETVTNCSDGGVLGVVTGIIGSFQALEAIKVITGMGPSYSQKMLLFDAGSGSVRVVKLRGRNPKCASCGDERSITELIDYVQFCGSSATDKSITRFLLGEKERVSCLQYKRLQTEKHDHILLDVRDKNQYDIAHLEGSVNIPWSQLPRRLGELFDLIGMSEDDDEGKRNLLPVYVLCRLGNDSQLAVKLLQASGVEKVWDLEGGLYAWSDFVDPSFPKF
ncbi:UNVERIFIED_CONTAM: Molybdenum cofactor synthesis protein 3 [Siphonaria sp. JEL0065]|nr:Molybdenum cofactor synthesis protein 3 [Siphonaria sp. JEL0065]